MAKFRKKPVVIEATQWFKNGDHPRDNSIEMFDYPIDPYDTGREDTFEKPQVIREGEIVRYFRAPDVDGSSKCRQCGTQMHVHGWIDTLEGGHIVCPGDWIITGINGENYPCKPDIFQKTYDAADETTV